ncbi:SGNH/GDSL hydrolase family protein [Citrobacter freundii]
MTTYSTGNLLGSAAAKDLYDNAQNFDHLSNDREHETWKDRLGVERLTWHGMEERYKTAIVNLGWNPVGTFQGGAIVNAAGDIVQDTSDLTWYRWDDLTTLPKNIPAGSTPGSTGGTGKGKWQAVDVADVLRKDLAKPTGASLSGHFQSTVRQHLIESAHITDFGGGVGAMAAVNASALAAARSAVGSGKIIFPQPGIYDFPIGTDLTGFIMSPVDGVVIRGPATGTMAWPGIVTDNDFRVYFNAGEPKDYYIDIRANYHIGSRGANKSLWLNDGNVENYEITPVNANTILVKQFALGVGDDISNVTPAGRTASSLFLQPPTGGATQLGVIPAAPGTELVVAVNNIPDNGGEIAIGIIFSTGYAVVRGYPGSGSWSLSTKYAGQPSTDQAINPDGGGTATYSASNNLLTVRSITTTRAQVLVNGVSFADIQITSGAIQWMGVGATNPNPTTGVVGGNFTGWYSKSFKVAASPRSQFIGIIGDSISDGSIHGAWPVWAAEALDGSLGIRINGIENRAVSGQTLDQQIANLASNPFVNASVVVIFIGTNDIQGGNSLSAFQVSLNSLLNTLQSQGRQSVLVIPPQWILKTDGEGLPDNGTTNSSKGGDIRAAIGRIAADSGLQLVDATEITGPINPGYYSSPYADPMLRDLIHPTAYGYRILGYEIARAVAAQLCPVVKTPSEWVSFATFSAGVSGSAQYRYTKGGIELRGKLEAATALSGTIFTIPECIRQSIDRYFIQWGNTGSIPIAVKTDGTVFVHNNPSSNQISLDGIILTN